MGETEDIKGTLTRGVYLVFLLWALYMMAEVYTWNQFEDWALPTLFGVPLIAAAVAKLLTLRYPWIVERVTPDHRSSMDEFQDEIREVSERVPVRTQSEQLRSGLLITAWLVALVIGLFVVGYWIILPAFTFAFTWYLSRDLRLAAVLTLVFAASAYAIFVAILDAFIWEGILL